MISGLIASNEELQYNYFSLRTNYFVKNIKIDGFSVEWHDSLGESELIELEDGIHILEYTKFAKDGFGQHKNEENFKKKIEFFGGGTFITIIKIE